MVETQVITWKVNGLLDCIKRGAVLRNLKRLASDVVMLQETHLMGTKCGYLGRMGFDRLFHAGFTRGVAILLRRSFPFVTLGF